MTVLSPEPMLHSDDHWLEALQAILAEPRRLRVHYQPIVDLERATIRGYEALARFPDWPDVSPRAWFDAAARLGCAGALEAQVVEAALTMCQLVPGDRFVSLNVTPQALACGALHTRVGGASLERIVIEVLDRSDDVALRDLGEAVDQLRRRGAVACIDETDDEFGLQRAAALRPAFVKVPIRRLLDHERGESSIVASLRQATGDRDLQVVATAVETRQELHAAVRRGIPLAQGFELGRPDAAPTPLDRGVRAAIRAHTFGGIRTQTIGDLADHPTAVLDQPGVVADAFALQPRPEVVVCVDGGRRPAGVIDRATHIRGGASRRALCLPRATSVSDAAQLAMARDVASRFDPIVCVDAAGAYDGLVRMERLVSALAR